MKIMTKDVSEFRRLNDIIPEYDEDLMDKYFYNQFDDKMKELIDNIMLDRHSTFMEYVAHSNVKTLSVFVRSLISTNRITIYNDYYILDDKAIKTLNNIIYSRYYEKWNKLYRTLIVDYNPIKPYDIHTIEDSTESMNTSSTIQKNNKNNYNNEETIDSENENNVNTYGFNSIYPVPTDNSNGNNSSNSSSKGTNEEITDTSSTYEREKPFHKEVDRVGNIGNITIQELIEKEREIQYYQIIDTIFEDLDRVLTRSKYI